MRPSVLIGLEESDHVRSLGFSPDGGITVSQGEGGTRFPLLCALRQEESGLKVKRIVANVAVSELAAAKRFYRDILGLDILMDMGWIATYGSSEKTAAQVSFMTEGGSGTPVPDLSIEVDDLDTALARIKKEKIPVEYGPTSEPWGVRRFFVRDPFGKLVNILVHLRAS
jgi:catechol 2,3-dioxygenase-like lactoylglutathione lyase family enzyme